jgi:hypothetical protein
MTKVMFIIVALKGSVLTLGVAAGEGVTPCGSVRVTLAVLLAPAVRLEERVAVDVMLALKYSDIEAVLLLEANWLGVCVSVAVVLALAPGARLGVALGVPPGVPAGEAEAELAKLSEAVETAEGVQEAVPEAGGGESDGDEGAAVEEAEAPRVRDGEAACEAALEGVGTKMHAVSTM